VSNAQTLEELNGQESQQSLRPVHRYLQKHNATRPWLEVAHRFGVTSAFWLVASSLLGLGDRHCGNIMVRDDGSLVHLDYGYILGSDPKLQKILQTIGCAGAIRVDLQDILDILGPSEEDAFWKPLRLTFKVLRSHARLLIEQLQIFQELFPQDLDVPSFISQSCYADKSDEKASDMFVEFVQRCSQSNYVSLVDMAHAQAQKQLLSKAVATAASGFGSFVTSTLQGLEYADNCKVCRCLFARTWMECFDCAWRYHCRKCQSSVCRRCLAFEKNELRGTCLLCVQQAAQESHEF